MVAACLALVLGAVAVHLKTVRRAELNEIKPYLTYTRAFGVAKDCDGFKNHFGRWPESLSELRAFYPDLGEWGVDMWGRELKFFPYSEKLGYGRIISYGRDGTPGGGGEGQHIEIRFPIQSNPSWNNEVESKLKKPELRAQ